MRSFNRLTGLFVALVAFVLGTTALLSAQDEAVVQEKTETQKDTVRIGPAITIEKGTGPRIKWEYKIIRHNGHAEATNAQPLNELGGDGWELCESQVMPDAAPKSRLLLIFKRQASEGVEASPAKTDTATIRDREAQTDTVDEINN